ncbi:hypothetical protein EP331_14540 [bacterium]|nr:MAG: hypothetical protein EP331_14540 [bacterium]
MGALETKLIEELTPLYKQLVEVVEKTKHKNNVSGFIPHYGFEYESCEYPKLLFVGKAVNGWGDKPNLDYENWLNIDKTDRYNQLHWVKKCEGQNTFKECKDENNNYYNTRKSAFWRVIKRLSMNYFHEDKTTIDSKGSWYEKIAWTNLYKIAPSNEGNPDLSMINAQQELCAKILAKEIEVLSPNVVIFFTSGWENPFKLHFPDLFRDSIKVAGFGRNKKYEIFSNVYEGKLIIRTVHPQGKPETEHVDLMTKLIDKHCGVNQNE